MTEQMKELSKEVMEKVTGGAETEGTDENGNKYYVINGVKIYAKSFAEAVKWAREHGILD